jgi:hypothetical protein
MNDGAGPVPESDPAYAYRPSLLGAPHRFVLGNDRIDWSVGGKSGRVPYRDIRRMRLSFRPASMQSQRFLTEIWAIGAPKLQILSSSWKSMVEQERLDKPYAAFIAELHRRIAAAAPPARFERGNNPVLYWMGLIVLAAVSLGLALLVVSALQSQAMGGAAFIGVFMLLFLWQGGNFFRRNRPGLYRPEAPPAELMPKG